ncbi:hypothetical protein [Agromyces mangrovi Wang et al. 2018]|uniref:hypothetical protein n=1 Tax=Agromyces mangrovi TaxID=1858653 RepID=UPI0025733725|nr:hypothetical protein [Agromyces mangrovi]BDZ63156.1 hypothetical protein GCM10025877_00940 [Agromyces mangrovi]
MSESIQLADRLSLGDLQTYIGRAARVDDGSVRIIAGSGILAVYTAILYPRGILDETPTVLGLRTFSLADRTEFDEVVPMRSLATRVDDTLARTADGAVPSAFTRPHGVSTVTWAGISPPRGGWLAHSPVAQSVLEDAARIGIAEVAAAVPEGTGEQLVEKVRSEVWGRPMEGLEFVPAGAGFAALSLGFLGGDEEVGVFETGPWTRLSTRRGHVLVRRRAWSLKG